MDFETLWQTVIQAMHQAASEGSPLPRAALDRQVAALSGGTLKSFSDLVEARQRRERVSQSLEQQELAEPGPALTGAAGVASGLTLGLARRLPAFGELMGRAEEAHPFAALGGEALGAAAPSVLAGAGGAMLGSRIPAIAALHPVARAAATQGAAGGLIGGLSVGQHEGATAGDYAKGTATGALLGSSLGILGQHLSGLRAGGQADDYLREMVRSNAPLAAERPLLDFRRGMEQLQAAPQDLPLGALTETNREAMRGLLRFPAVREAAKKVIQQHVQRINQELAPLSQEYERILTAGDKTIKRVPEAKQLWREQALPGKPTARAIFETYKQARARITEASNDLRQGRITRAEYAKTIKKYAPIKERAEQALSQVPGFAELQARAAPLYQRLEQLQTLERLTKIRPRTRTVSGTSSLKETIQEMLGRTPRELSEQTARAAAEVMLRPGTSSLIELLTKPEPLSYLTSGAVGPVMTGADSLDFGLPRGR